MHQFHFSFVHSFHPDFYRCRRRRRFIIIFYILWFRTEPWIILIYVHWMKWRVRAVQFIGGQTSTSLFCIAPFAEVSHFTYTHSHIWDICFTLIHCRLPPDTFLRFFFIWFNLTTISWWHSPRLQFTWDYIKGYFSLKWAPFDIHNTSHLIVRQNEDERRTRKNVKRHTFFRIFSWNSHHVKEMVRVQMRWPNGYTIGPDDTT